MLAVTTRVSPDEPCLLLTEQVLQRPGSRGWRRFQILHVMRGDTAAEYRKDMGPASKFKGVDSFRVPGGARDADTGRYYVEHTVGELRDVADALRDLPGPQPEPRSAQQMIQGYHDTKEQQRSRRVGRVSVAVR